MEDKALYHERRADEEVAAGAASPDERVRAVHLALAELHARRASDLIALARRSRMLLVAVPMAPRQRELGHDPESGGPRRPQGSKPVLKPAGTYSATMP